MVSSSKVKIIQSLDKKKYRQKYNLFVVEGIKNIKEFVFSNFSLKNAYSIEKIDYLNNDQYKIISYDELKKISFLKNPHNALALFEIPSINIHDIKGFQLVLDSIQDPGNLGTIIRLADWFGIDQILCNKETVDVYNPKVIQATMGSLSRVNVVYVDDLTELIKNSDLPVLVTDMQGESIYNTSLPNEGLLIMGNEGNGVSEGLKAMASKKLTIPRFGKFQKTESLNVAMSTGIILSELFSQKTRNESK